MKYIELSTGDIVSAVHTDGKGHCLGWHNMIALFKGYYTSPLWPEERCLKFALYDWKGAPLVTISHIPEAYCWKADPKDPWDQICIQLYTVDQLKAACKAAKGRDLTEEELARNPVSKEDVVSRGDDDSVTPTPKPERPPEVEEEEEPQPTRLRLFF